MLATALVQVLRYAAKWQPRWSDLTRHEVHHGEERGERRYSVVSLPDNPAFHVFSTHTADTVFDTDGPQYHSTHTTLRDAKAAIAATPAETTYSDAMRPPPKQPKLKSGGDGDTPITTRRKPFSFSQAVAETFGKRSRR